MNKHFIISTRSCEGIRGTVLATSFHNPLDEIDLVERDLKKMKIAGPVVFDLLLSNGNRANRYFIGDFDGRHFVEGKFECADAKYEVFSRISATLFKENATEVNPSLLSRAMQYAVRSGIPL